MEGTLADGATVMRSESEIAGGRRIAIQPAAFVTSDSRQLTFSPGIEARDTLWLSGYTAARRDPASQRPTVDGDVVAQARFIYEKIRTIVESAGVDRHHVVRMVDYVTLEGCRDYARVADARREVFGPRMPAGTTVVVDGLLRSGALIEIEALAVRGPNVDVKGRPEQVSDGGEPRIRRVGDVLYLSTLASVEPGSQEVSCSASAVQQTRRIYERAREVLAASGVDLGHVVKVVEFLTPGAREQYAQIRQVRETLLARKVAVTTVVMARGMHPDALIQIEFVAAADRRSIADAEVGDASPDRAGAVRAGGLVFASGQRAVSRDSGRVQCPGDVVGQTRIAYSNLAKVLATAGVGLDAVVHTTEFVTRAGLAEYRRTADVRREIFEPPYPAATGIVCRELLEPEALVEVDAVAILAS